MMTEDHVFDDGTDDDIYYSCEKGGAAVADESITGNVKRS